MFGKEGLALGRGNESVHHCVTDPVGGEGHVVVEFANAFADVGGVGGVVVSYGDDALAENDHVDVHRVHVGVAGLVGLVEGAEADEVVLFEELDFLACFLGDDILGRQAMDAECALEGVELVFGGIVDVEPPDSTVLG